MTTTTTTKLKTTSKSTTDPPRLSTLQEQWKDLVNTTLPTAAAQHSSSQKQWPVRLNHCFARIILDNALGQGERVWYNVVAAPAVKNMTAKQLEDAIKLGEQIWSGEADLCALNEESLRVRGKLKRSRDDGAEKSPAKSKKPKKEESDIRSHFFSNTQNGSTKGVSKTEEPPSPPTSPGLPHGNNKSNKNDEDKDLLHYRRLIIESDRTVFSKRTLMLLSQIPRGRWSTYQSLANHITNSRGKLCPARAIGQGMKNNPFAPTIPCHRIVAADARIGGFKGVWDKESSNAKEKIKLLRSEGVGFAPDGKLIGRVWEGWNGWEELLEG